MDTGSLDNIYGLGGYRWGYRDKARIIAIIDVVSSTLNLGNTFVQFLAVSAYSAYINSVDPDQSKVWIDLNQRKTIEGDQMPGPKEIIFTPHTFKKLAWIFVLAHFAIHFSQLIFAINLYTGTARTTPAKAHSACRLWFVTSSILLGILGIKIFFHPRDANVIYNMLEIVFRAVGMYIVGEYAKEIKRDGIGPRPPPVYFSSHAGLGGPPGSHHHRRHGGSRGIVGAYSLQPPVPVYFSPHMHYESPPKYEEIMRQSAAEAAAAGIPVPDTAVNISEPGTVAVGGGPVGAADNLVVDGLSLGTPVAPPARLPRYEEITEQAPHPSSVQLPVPQSEPPANRDTSTSTIPQSPVPSSSHTIPGATSGAVDEVKPTATDEMENEVASPQPKLENHPESAEEETSKVLQNQ